jgi:hypothetical protein
MMPTSIEAPLRTRAERVSPLNLGRAPSIALILLAMKLILLALFGPQLMNDSGGYLAYADRLLLNSDWMFRLDVQSEAVPVLAFRPIGYPAVIALTKLAFGDGWQIGVVLLQIGMSVYAALRFAQLMTELGLRSTMVVVATLGLATSQIMLLDQTIMTDSLYTSFLTLAIILIVHCALHRSASIASIVQIGSLLTLCFLFRDASAMLFLALIPAIWLSYWVATASIWRSVACTLLVLLPLLVAVSGYRSWNDMRTGEAFVTTAAHTNMIYALLGAYRINPAVFDRDEPIDKAVRLHAKDWAYDDVIAISANWHAVTQIDTIQASKLMTARFWQSWQCFPLTMLRASIGRLRETFLLLSFRPFDSLDGLHGSRGIETDSANQISPSALLQAVKNGSILTVPWLILAGVFQIASVITSILFLSFPLSMARSQRREQDRPLAWVLLGLWCFVIGFVAIHSLVHIELRHLAALITPVMVVSAFHLRQLRGVDVSAIR